MIGIVDWRVAELEHLGVPIRYDTWAEKDDVLALEPDVVIVATGGIPRNPELEEGDDLVTSSWDIIGGAAKAADRVLVYDDFGGFQGMTAAETVANSGAKLELVTPERFFAPDMGGMNHVPYMRTFHEKGVRITINTRLSGVRRDGNFLVATLSSDFAEGWPEERRVDQVVVERGTIPMDELYFDLKPLSKNRGNDQRMTTWSTAARSFLSRTPAPGSSSIVLATPWPRATSTSPSTTPCDSGSDGEDEQEDDPRQIS